MYSVRYKLSRSFFFKTLKNVKGDGIIPESGNRFFILLDETRIEIPRESIVIFSSDRFIFIRKEMEKEIGQPIPVG